MVYKQMAEVHRTVYTDMDAVNWMTEIAEAVVYLHGLDEPVMHRVRFHLKNCMLIAVT